MKQSDAKKLGKATEALLKRLRACQSTLKAREKTVLTALESVFTCNDAISTEFEKWDEISHELDEDAEIAPVMVDPKLDLDALIVDAAFESVHLELEKVIESFEDILIRANDYQEPEEEEEEDEIEEDDTEEDEEPEEEEEEDEGGEIEEDDTEEDEEPEPEGERFGCHAYACYADSPSCETLDEAEEAALKAGWKFDPKGWPYCPKHRDQA
jgi:hypothetical protein